MAFIPTSQTSCRRLAAKQAERLSPRRSSSCETFHRQPYPVCIAVLPPAYADGETAARNGVTVYEADVRPPERYLMERFITSPVWVDGETRNGVIRNAS